MADVAVAIVIHVLCVLWWIGGLAFVTAVFLPSLRQRQQGNALAAFQAIESRFEPQARIAVLLVGLSGLYMLIRLHFWSQFLQLRFWWLDGMVLFWLFFMLLLFVLGPSGLLKRLMRHGGDEARVWRRLHNMHRILLVIALVIVAGAVFGSHGF